LCSREITEIGEYFLLRVVVVIILHEAVKAPQLYCLLRKQRWDPEMTTSPYKDALMRMFVVMDAVSLLLGLECLISN